MAAMPQVSMNEYMATHCRADREYIDGEVVERNLGIWEHARLQALIAVVLHGFEEFVGVVTVLGWRVRYHQRGFAFRIWCWCRTDRSRRCWLSLLCW